MVKALLCFSTYAEYIKTMSNEKITTIRESDFNIYGWNDKLNQLKQKSAHKALPHGRVAVVHRTCYEVISESGVLQCELNGKHDVREIGL